MARLPVARLVQEGSSFVYWYDFGDDWRHKVVVEKVRRAEPGERIPGQRRCDQLIT